MTRKSTKDWLEGGLQILAKDGLNSLTIDRMAQAGMATAERITIITAWTHRKLAPSWVSS